MTKEEIRKRILQIRNQLDGIQSQNAAKAAEDRILATDFVQKANTVMIYLSFGSELDTTSLLDKLLRMGKNVCVPGIKGDTIVPLKYLSNCSVKKGKFNINEPSEGIIEENFIDVCVTPLAACDKDGNRIGYGKGYFDRFFQKFKGLKCGYCYDFQIVEQIQPENTDKPLDAIVTDRQTVCCRNRRIP